MSVLFELIAARYERRSMLITANQPFGQWDKILPDPAIDRLVHHATILEMNVESYRRREAFDRKPGLGRPAAHATIEKTENALPRICMTGQMRRKDTPAAVSGCVAYEGHATTTLHRRHPRCLRFSPAARELSRNLGDDD